MLDEGRGTKADKFILVQNILYCRKHISNGLYHKTMRPEVIPLWAFINSWDIIIGGLATFSAITSGTEETFPPI